MDTNNNPVQETPVQATAVQADPMPEKQQKNGISIAALVCGIISFCCCNPLYLVSIAAIILGIVGMSKNDGSKGMAVAGLILGAVSIIFCLIVDLVTIPLTMGFGFLF